MPYHVSENEYEVGHRIETGQYGRMIKEFRPGGPMPSPEFINILLFEVALEASRVSLAKPIQPSRLDCVFAYGSLQDAIRFRDQRRAGAHIYEVAPLGDNPPLLRDAARLGGKGMQRPYAVSYSEASKHYWNATVNADDPELLYDCPLRVIRRV